MPNANKMPREYDEEMCLNQVKYLGLVENMRVRRAGYAYRMTYERFVKRYNLPCVIHLLFIIVFVVVTQVQAHLPRHLAIF